MKKYLILIVFFIFLFSCKEDIPIENNETPNDSTEIKDTVATVSGLEYVYDINAVSAVYVEVSTEEWNKLLSYYDQNPYNEEYVVANLTFVKNNESDSFTNVGLKLRGNTSRRRPEGATGEMHNAANPDWHHAHFGVKLNKFVTGQKLHDIEKINLKWFKDDGDYVREIYCYDLFERYGVWTAPQSSYGRLFLKIKEDNKWINYGVYEILEPVDDEFLKNRATHFKDIKGNLWKANYGADFVNTDKSRMGVETVTLTSTYRPVYDLKTDSDNLAAAKNQLVDFITNFNSKQGDDFKTWISSTTDVSLLLKTYAVSVICGMWDDYWNNSNNFYFYFDSNNKFYLIPFDYDNTLGTSLLMTNSGTQDLLNWGKSSNPLVEKIISIDEYKTMYINDLYELCNSDNDLFYYKKSMDRIVNWQNMIQDYISNDTGEDMQIVDVPASWGNCSQYRLLSSTNNYFIIRSQNLPN